MCVYVCVYSPFVKNRSLAYKIGLCKLEMAVPVNQDILNRLIVDMYVLPQ